MKVALLVLWGDSLTYTLAKALTFSGHEAWVRVADANRHFKAKWGTHQRIAAIPGVKVVAGQGDDQLPPIDGLLVQGHPALLHYGELLQSIARPAERITLVSAGDRSRPLPEAWKLQLREWRWLGDARRKVGRVAYKDGYHSVDWFGLIRPRYVVGFDPHSRFLQDETLFAALHVQDWEPDVARPIRVNFIGSRDPESRGRILDSIEPFFTRSSRDAPGEVTSKSMVWHVYSDAQPAALGQQEFLDVLSRSDFTLAPLGYSHVTHRPIEALLRGSIPVLSADELDLYDLDLADGVNCVTVARGGWPPAMRRIVAMTDTEIAGMRRKIRAMLADKVAYPALARDMVRRLGFGGAGTT